MATTTGFVQRSDLSGPITCVWVGATPASTEGLFVNINQSDSPATRVTKLTLTGVLFQAQVTGRLVELTHGSNSGEITSCRLPGAEPGATPYQLDAIEVTQSIQDLALSVPLLAGKRTVVRVYLSKHSGPAQTVTAELSLRQHPLNPPIIVSSLNSVTLHPADAGNITLQRIDENRSLNFVLDPAQTAEGPLTIELADVLDQNGNPVSVGVRDKRTVFFHRTPPLRLRIVGIRYQYQPTPTSQTTTHIPQNIDYAWVLSWLHRAYPVAQVVSSQILVDAPGGPVFTPDDEFGCGTINAHIAAIRALDVDSGMDARTLYYGLVHNGGFFMRGCVGSDWVSCGPTGAFSNSWPWDTDGSWGDWYAGHEIGHSLGRIHPGFCNQSGTDPSYPFPGGQLSNSDDGFCGFDVGDPLAPLAMDALPGTLWHDVMTYCDRQWVSAYTSRGLRLRLLDVDAMPAAAGGAGPMGAGPGRGGGRPNEPFPRRRPAATVREEPTAPVGGKLVSVVASVNLTRGRGAIRYVNPVDNLRPTPEDAASVVALVVRGSGGPELRRYSLAVTVDPERSPGEDVRALLDAVIPVPAEAATIELVVGGEVTDTYGAPAPPAVRGLQMVSGAPGALSMRVDLERPLSETQSSYAVQISRDGGATWETIAVGLRDPVFEVDRSAFRPGSEISVRILATGGFSRSVVATETVRI